MSTQRVVRILRQSGWLFGLTLAFLIGSLFASRGGFMQRAMFEPVAAATLLETTAGNTLLSYQGRIANPTTNVSLPDGTFGIIFSLFDAPSGGTQLWTESRSVVQERGLINVLLGEVTALPLPIFDGRDLWLQLQVNGEGLNPRQRLAWVAYAINARKAETVNDNAITSAKIADGQVTSADIGDEQVTTADIVDGSGSGLNADLLDGRDQASFAAANHTHPGLAPIAFGTVQANGAISSGTGNFSVVWNATQSWYEITITGVNYHFLSYSTLVTPACSFVSPNTNSVSGNLVVEISTSPTVNTTCIFQFVVFKA